MPIKMNGATSGYTQLQAAAVAASNTLTLPASNGALVAQSTTTAPTNGQIPIGNGTDYTAATITAGTGITVTNGAGTITLASSAVTQPQVYSQAFYSSGSWTAPTGVTRVRVWVIGGGGGGCTATCATNSGGVGGMAMGVYTVSPGTGYTVTVGAGGAAASTGVSGGTTSFGGVISATGGSGGSGYYGASGSGSGGTVINSVGWSAASLKGIYPNWSIPIAGGYGFPPYNFNLVTAAQVAGGAYPAGLSGNGLGGIGGMVYLEWVQ